MKKIFPIVLFIFLLFKYQISVSQISLAPLGFDQSRYSNLGNVDTRLARTKPTFLDTLELPFFEDFTQVSAPIDTIFTENAQPLVIKTFGHHGLKNFDKIFLKVGLPNDTKYQGNYFAIVRNKREFLISSTSDANGIIQSDGTPILANWVRWNRPNAQIGPNPDTLRWYGEGGTLISNRISQNPPSLNVATFDGLDANGRPYRSSATGSNTDELTSQCFNLLGLEAKDNVVLSFYLEGKGLAVAPLRKDSIFLLFKDNQQIWNYVWGKKGTGDDIPYYQVNVKINDAKYFHANFQFRFQRFNENAGAVGTVFNVDYIHFDKNWNSSKEFPSDRAVNATQSSILKDYTAMPYFQFSNEALSEKVNFSVRNNSKDTVGFGFDQKYVYNDGTSSELSKIEVNFLDPAQTLKGEWTVNNSLLRPVAGPTEIKYEITANTNDKMSESRIRYQMNNSDSGKVVLNNYYALDDGTAERQLSILNSAGGRLMIKYRLNSLPDTITHIDMFTPLTWWTLGSDPRYKISRLIVANSDLNIVESSSTDIVLEFPEGRNLFARYKLTKPFIPNTNEFYIGIEQRHGLEVAYGWDINKGTLTSKFYGFPNGPWQDINLAGAPMIRPVLRINEPSVSVDKYSKHALQVEIFPIPASESLTITGEVQKIELFNLEGTLMIAQHFNPLATPKIVDVSSINSGVYMLKCVGQNKQATKKVIVNR